MIRNPKMRVLSLLAATAIATALGRPAHAATLASGPLRVAGLDTNVCGVANTTAKPIDAEVHVTIDGGGAAATASCPGLKPNAVCVAEDDASTGGYFFCSATVSSKKAARGTFCNLAAGTCLPLQ